MRAAAANIASFLDRYEGVHILMVDTPDLDGVAARLTAAGVGHGGVHDIRRPVETGAGTRMEPARYLEIAAREGRVGFARNVTTPDDLSGTDHPNGATGLTECVLAAEDAALPGLARRYAAYFGDGHEDGQLVRYERAGVVVAGASALGGLLPGERVSGPPGFVAYTISVRDVAATERLLRRDGVPARRTGAAELLVPARAALGAAIVFRQYG